MNKNSLGNKKVFNEIEDSIDALNIGETEKKSIYEGLIRLKKQKINLMITGATGSGKSSTINAMFDADLAKVGTGPDPETMQIQKYELDNLILWDSPGLGDGKEKDLIHAKGIIKKLNEIDSDGNPLIDLVLVILDGSSRDLGTSYDLINHVIIPNLGKNAKDRILVAINQADVAMKGRYWNHESNQPMSQLVNFLNDKVRSVKGRIKEATGVDVEPIYYSAGYKEEGDQQKPWNLTKLLYLIVKNTKAEKRLTYLGNVSTDHEAWEDNDGLMDYPEKMKESFQEAAARFSKNIAAGAAAGAALGSVIPVVGTAVGATLGGLLGTVFSFFGR